MKKRISLLLVLLLLVSALTPAALAADDADTTEAVPATPEQLAAVGYAYDAARNQFI